MTTLAEDDAPGGIHDQGDMPVETWKPVPGWEGYYEVSDAGRVSSVPRSVPRSNGRPLNLRGRILKCSPSSDGYPTAALCRDNERLLRSVHLLVLEAFVGPRPEGMEACHHDDIPTNNQLSNLRWDTKPANTYDRIRNGLHVQARKTHCPQGHPYDEKNTYIHRHGVDGKANRICRTCLADRKRESRAVAS